MNVSSNEYYQDLQIIWMIMRELENGGHETLRPRKKRRDTCKDHSRARTQASASQDSMQSSANLQADFFEKNCLRKKLEAVSLLRSEVLFLVAENGDKGWRDEHRIELTQ